MLDQALKTYTTQLKNPHYRVRLRAISALEKLNDPGAVPLLIEALGDFDRADESSKVNMLAGTALIAYGEQGRDALIAALPPQPGHPHDSWRRYWTAEALGFFPSQATTQALINLLSDADRSAVEGAVEAIIRLQASEALPYLQQLYQERRFPDGSIYTALYEAIDMFSRKKHSS
jgi:HEAT repeat protein